jgi:hypothetical protein
LEFHKIGWVQTGLINRILTLFIVLCFSSAIYANRHYLEMYKQSHPKRLAQNEPGKPKIIGDVYIHPTANVDPTAVVSSLFEFLSVRQQHSRKIDSSIAWTKCIDRSKCYDRAWCARARVDNLAKHFAARP